MASKPQTCSPVFVIPEIITSILCNLPPVELITTTRAVCKLWKSAVETSPELKWKTWNYTTLPPLPKSLQTGSKTSNATKSSPDPASEISPLALHCIEMVWKRCMKMQRKKQHNCSANVDSQDPDPAPTPDSDSDSDSTIGQYRGVYEDEPMALPSWITSKLKPLEELPESPISSSFINPSKFLFRPPFHGGILTSYAGSGESRCEVYVEDTCYALKELAFIQETMGPVRRLGPRLIHHITTTLVRGVEAAKDISAPGWGEDFGTEKRFFKLTIHVYPRNKDGTLLGYSAGLEPTAIKVFLKMFEPFDIERVETTSEVDTMVLNRTIKLKTQRHYSMSLDREDPFKAFRDVIENMRLSGVMARAQAAPGGGH
ncbi:hypothetical protein TWF281_004804 [Arthrobotrys megalospora]